LGNLALSAESQKEIISSALSKARNLLPRFAVFSLAPVSLAAHLGFILTDRVEVRCYQYDRDRHSWAWDARWRNRADSNISVSGFPSSVAARQGEVLVRISLSAKVRPDDTRRTVPGALAAIDIGVANPDVVWLKSPRQLDKLRLRFREVLAKIRSLFPNCVRIHIFYAGPAGGAVIVGQQINPKMNPPVVFYEYSQQGTRRHRPALTLSDVSAES